MGHKTIIAVAALALAALASPAFAVDKATALLKDADGKDVGKVEVRDVGKDSINLVQKQTLSFFYDKVCWIIDGSACLISRSNKTCPVCRPQQRFLILSTLL